MGLFDKAPKDASEPLRVMLERADSKFAMMGGDKEKSDKWTKLLCDYVEAMAGDINTKESLLMLIDVLTTCMIYHKAHLEYLENNGQKKPDGATAH